MAINELDTGKHKVELVWGSTGSYDPWFIEIMLRYGISLMCTSDMAAFMRIDDVIFKVENIVSVKKKLDTWREMADVMTEEADKEIEKMKEEGAEGFEKRLSNRELIYRWNLGAIYALDEMKGDSDEDEITIENAKRLLGRLFNRGCFVPDEKGVSFTDGKITFVTDLYETTVKGDKLSIFVKGMAPVENVPFNFGEVDANLCPYAKKPRRERQTKDNANGK